MNKILLALVLATCLYIGIASEASGAVSYNAPTKTITWSGSSSLQYFEDIYRADLASGWSVVTSCGTGCYCVDAFIVHNSGTVSDVAATVRWKDGLRTVNSQTLLRANGGTLTFGAVVSVTDRSTEGGCTFIADIPAGNFSGHMFKEVGGNIYLNGCLLTRTSYLASVGNLISRCWDCTLSSGHSIQSNSDVFNTTISGAWSGLQNSSASNVNIYDCNAIVVSSTQNIVVRDIYARGNTKLAIIYGAYSVNLVNCDIDLWDSILWVGGATGTVYRQYSTDVVVQTQSGTPITATTVQIWTAGGTLVTATVTSASGTIPTQTITHSNYQLLTGNVPTMHTPHRIRVTADGYLDYEDIITIDEYTSLHIALTAESIGYTGILNWLADRTMFIVAVLAMLLFGSVALYGLLGGKNARAI